VAVEYRGGKGKVSPNSFPSIGPGADPSVEAQRLFISKVIIQTHDTHIADQMHYVVSH